MVGAGAVFCWGVIVNGIFWRFDGRFCRLRTCAFIIEQACALDAAANRCPGPLGRDCRAGEPIIRPGYQDKVEQLDHHTARNLEPGAAQYAGLPSFGYGVGNVSLCGAGIIPPERGCA